MDRKLMKKILFCIFVLSGVAFGEAASETVESQTSTTASVSRFTGNLDLRPSYRNSEKDFYMDNNVKLGYAATPNISLGYSQSFQLGISQPEGSAVSSAPRTRIGEGYAWAGFQNVLQLSENLAMHYEPRLYLPTDSQDALAGLQTSLRNYLKFEYAASPQWTLFFWEVPTFSLYSKDGYVLDGTPVANYFFENRIESGVNASLLGGSLQVYVPIIFKARKHNPYDPNAVSDRTWGHSLTLYPEITARVADKTWVGLGYESGNLVSDSLAQWRVSDGFNEGVVQLIFQQTI